MMQYSSIGFLNVILRLSDIFNHCGSLKAVDRFYYRMRTSSLKKKETDVYEYGYYFALSATLINATTALGYLRDYLDFSCRFYFPHVHST